jgi:hypothetical protein
MCKQIIGRHSKIMASFDGFERGFVNLL